MKLYRSKLTDIGNKRMVTPREGWGRINQEFGINKYTLSEPK